MFIRWYMYLVPKFVYHKTLTTKLLSVHTIPLTPLQLYTPHVPTSLLAHLHAHFTLTTLCTTPPTHSTHTLHQHTPPTHTYLLVGLFHNVSCLSLVLLFESLRESISLRQITLALLLCPAETMPAMNSPMVIFSSLVFTISWFLYLNCYHTYFCI